MSYAASLVDVCNSFLTRMKRSQCVIPRVEPVKVNLGSYLVVEDGWINVEGTIHAFLSKNAAILAKLMFRFSRVNEMFSSEREYIDVLKTHDFVHHDLTYGLPFPDNSVDYIYTSHVLEHLYPDSARNLLHEARRVLKDGGLLRICVPDLKHAIDLYLSGQKERALEYFFQDSCTGAFHRHKYMYDFEMLEHALDEAGFASVQQCAYRQGRVPDIERLDNRPEETLFVEAVK